MFPVGFGESCVFMCEVGWGEAEDMIGYEV